MVMEQMDPIEEARRRIAQESESGIDKVQLERNYRRLAQGEVAVYREILAKQTDPDSISQLRGKIDRLEATLRVKAGLMSPEGSLAFLNKDLEDRRWDAGIIDEAFMHAAVGETVYVYQIRVVDTENVKGSQIIRPEVSVAGERFNASRAIVVSAGLKARNYLWANGVDLGHVVRFAKLAALRIELGVVIDGVPEYLLILHCTEIRGSLDLGHQLFEGSATMWCDKGGKHKLSMSDGTTRDGYVEEIFNQEDPNGR